MTLPFSKAIWKGAIQIHASSRGEQIPTRRSPMMAAENTALAEARRISIRETHERKLAQIRGRIRTLQIEGKPKMIPLFESQMRVQEHKLAKAEQELDEASVGSMSIESVAVCILEIT